MMAEINFVNELIPFIGAGVEMENFYWIGLKAVPGHEWMGLCHVSIRLYLRRIQAVHAERRTRAGQ